MRGVQFLRLPFGPFEIYYSLNIRLSKLAILNIFLSPEPPEGGGSDTSGEPTDGWPETRGGVLRIPLFGAAAFVRVAAILKFYLANTRYRILIHLRDLAANVIVTGTAIGSLIWAGMRFFADSAAKKEQQAEELERQLEVLRQQHAQDFRALWLHYARYYLDDTIDEDNRIDEHLVRRIPIAPYLLALDFAGRSKHGLDVASHDPVARGDSTAQDAWGILESIATTNADEVQSLISSGRRIPILIFLGSGHDEPFKGYFAASAYLPGLGMNDYDLAVTQLVSAVYDNMGLGNVLIRSPLYSLTGDGRLQGTLLGRINRSAMAGAAAALGDSFKGFTFTSYGQPGFAKSEGPVDFLGFSTNGASRVMYDSGNALRWSSRVGFNSWRPDRVTLSIDRGQTFHISADHFVRDLQLGVSPFGSAVVEDVLFAPVYSRVGAGIMLIGGATHYAIADHRRRVRAAVGASLSLSAMKAGLPTEIAVHLISLFGHQADFGHELKSDDQFEVYYTSTDGRQTRMEYAELQVGGRVSQLYRYQPKVDQPAEYFDSFGVGAERLLLSAPVDGAHVVINTDLRPTSTRVTGDTVRGLDFLVPAGAPVVAAGAGTVSTAGPRGDGGFDIQVNIGQGIAFAYSGLSQLAPGVDLGSHVRQGEVIGFVGGAGTSVAPHLHYDVLLNGVTVDLLTLKTAPMRTLSGDDLRNFLVVRRQIDEAVAATPLSTRNPADGPF